MQRNPSLHSSLFVAFVGASVDSWTVLKAGVVVECESEVDECEFDTVECESEAEERDEVGRLVEVDEGVVDEDWAVTFAPN